MFCDELDIYVSYKHNDKEIINRFAKGSARRFYDEA